MDRKSRWYECDLCGRRVERYYSPHVSPPVYAPCFGACPGELVLEPEYKRVTQASLAYVLTEIGFLAGKDPTLDTPGAVAFFKMYGDVQVEAITFPPIKRGLNSNLELFVQSEGSYGTVNITMFSLWGWDRPSIERSIFELLRLQKEAMV